ncbi:hypothetical protein CISG_02564 [Coccidioides immitis RMSCC 3703]|uniref:Uncharacterized protein n=2 Tax=Coccidioides immitis TaxID=5501 RepID=A0A0J8U3A3_COCIT|nr:hypothetical protein CIRG_09152 [Coccidioides immitis RMSCC 2394]KMU81187.1 hypothetical protein CISG_02564 [Coccidioides immitis RMSCC 3703]
MAAKRLLLLCEACYCKIVGAGKVTTEDSRYQEQEIQGSVLLSQETGWLVFPLFAPHVTRRLHLAREELFAFPPQLPATAADVLEFDAAGPGVHGHLSCKPAA